jgi:peptidoglycan/xylan/chitin deacetylase (PgdA/CDA1 family)
VISAFAGKPAGEFGLEAKGIQLDLPAAARGAALTFDACGGRHGEGYDGKLIRALRKHEAPATLFINRRWAAANASLVRELAADPLFEIANHGTTHAPLASRGQSAYGIPGTASVADAYDEIMDNQHYLADSFGIKAKFFRSGTAHMDVLGAAMCRELRLVPMNFTVNLDAGATFPASSVAAQTALLGHRDVGIGHFNRPSSETAEGLATMLPRLMESLESRNLRLLRLSDAFARSGEVAGLTTTAIPVLTGAGPGE